MAKFNPKTKKQQKTEAVEPQPQIQLVPFERYAYEGLRAISGALAQLQKDVSVIKERMTFEDQNKKGK